MRIDGGAFAEGPPPARNDGSNRDIMEQLARLMGGAAMSTEKGPPARILVVDDDAVAAEGIRRLLQRRGYEVRTAIDLESAVAEARSWAPDVAICDWQLAVPPDGVEVARVLRRLHGSTIVMITAFELDALARASADLTVVSYLRKPIALDALMGAVAKSLMH